MAKTRRTLHTGGDDSAADRRRLFACVEDGDLDTVKRMVQGGVPVNIKESSRSASLLTVAAENAHLDIVKFLIKEGAYVNATDDSNFTPLVHTVGRTISFTEGDKRNSSGKMRSGFKKFIDVIKELLENNAHKSIKVGNSTVPILEILHVEDEDIIKLFNDNKNNNNRRNSNSTQEGLILGPAYYNHLYNFNNNNNRSTNRRKTRKHNRVEFSPIRV